MAARNPIRPLSSVMAMAMAMARRLSTSPAADEAAPYERLYRRLSALGGDPGGSVAETMKRWRREGRIATEYELIKCVRELRKYKSYNTGLALMEWMEQRGMNMSFSHHAIRIDLISKVKGIDKAEAYFSSLPEVAKNKKTYGALLNCYCLGKMEDKAIGLYEKMINLNLASNRLAYNDLMSLYSKLGQPDKVQAIFQQMKASSISPDSFTYCILMNSYASSNDIDSVEKVVSDMKDEAFASGWSIYATLAAIYNSAGLFKKSESALRKLELLMDGRDRSPFHFLISLYAGAGNLLEINRLWKTLRSAFSTTTNASYKVMLRALSKLDDVDAMEECFKEWESVHVSYDVRLVNVMIEAYLRTGMILEAESLRARAADKGVRSDLRTLELFMEYYLKRHEVGSALECFRAASSQEKWSPDKQKITAYLKYLEEVEDDDEVEVLRKNLEKLE